jgi:tyrosinase
MVRLAPLSNMPLSLSTYPHHRSDLTVTQREEYVAAVQCLMKKPPKAPKQKYPGSLNRFDDFVAFHVTHAGTLHNNNHLFAAHRYYLYIYEKALREECGYTGYQPVRRVLPAQLSRRVAHKFAVHEL